MPQVGKIFSQSEKRIELNDFFDSSELEEGEKAFVTIKKLDRITLRKIQLLSASTMSGKSSKKMFKIMREKNVSLDYFENMDVTDPKAIEILEEFTAENDDDDTQANEKLSANTDQYERMLIENGVDEKKHNFFDESGKVFNMNYDSLLSLKKNKMIQYLIDEILLFSKGIVLDDQKKKK
jgi:hypothetical protein